MATPIAPTPELTGKAARKFMEEMADWKKKCSVTTTKVFDKMNLDNLADYLK